MNADIKGALNQINTSWKAFTHRGKKMSKQDVKKVLEYALDKGYKTTKELTDKEVDKVLGLESYLFVNVEGDYSFEVTAKTPAEAYNKAYSAYGPQVEDMMYKVVK